MRLALDEFIVEAVVSVGVHVLLAQHVQINCQLLPQSSNYKDKMYKLLINTAHPRQHIISPQRILKSQADSESSKLQVMEVKECLLHTCQTEGQIFLYRTIGGEKKMMGQDFTQDIYGEDLEVRTQVLLVGSLGKSEFASLMKHVQLRRQNIELVQLVQEPSSSAGILDVIIYFKNVLFTEEFYSLLLQDLQLFVIYIQEVSIVSITDHPQLEKQLLFLINGWKFTKQSDQLQLLCRQEFVQLPMCYCCLLKLQYTLSGLPTKISTEQRVRPLSSCQTCLRLDQSTGLACSHCQSTQDIWICMVCSQVGCGRYKNADAFKHFLSSGHVITINLETQRIWNYQSDSFCHRLLPLHKQQATLRFPDYSGQKGNQLYEQAVESAFWQYCSLVSEELERQRAFYEKEKGRQEERFERQSSAVERALLDIQKQLDSKGHDVKKLLKKNKKLHKRLNQLQQKCLDDRELLENYDTLINQGAIDFTQQHLDQQSPRIQQKLKILQSLQTEIDVTLAKLTE